MYQDKSHGTARKKRICSVLHLHGKLYETRGFFKKTIGMVPQILFGKESAFESKHNRLAGNNLPSNKLGCSLFSAVMSEYAIVQTSDATWFFNYHTAKLVNTEQATPRFYWPSHKNQNSSAMYPVFQLQECRKDGETLWRV